MTTYTFSNGTEIDITKAEIRSANGDVLALGHKESELLHLLLASSPEVVSKKAITEQVWQRPTISESAISVAIAKLRKQLSLANIAEIEIITAKGVGYRAKLHDAIQEASQPITVTSSSKTPAETPNKDTASLVRNVQGNINHRKRIWMTVLLVFSLSIGYTLKWLYTFTECEHLPTERIIKNGTNKFVYVCWSENSKQDERELATKNIKQDADIILIDKNNNVSQFNALGERLHHDK